ncbi:MAG: anhydro-N-acetylmuramic acid kinase, partial [Chitinophagales bacterium]
MSGSSLDGLDIAYCRVLTSNKYAFQILHAETIAYPDELKYLLKNTSLQTENLHAADKKFGDFCGIAIQSFLQKHKIDTVDFIASHGHTIAHAPEKRFSLQIGNAEQMAQRTGLPVVYDFRNADIQAGGQGAPLVPICDKMLFPDFNVCLNIGGIANISYDVEGRQIGYDICAANQLLNHIAQQLDLTFDTNGAIARSGKSNNHLLQLLNSDAYFIKTFPKSLDNNYVQNNFISLMNASTLSPSDKLATATEHIATQIAESISRAGISKTQLQILVTGGGAYNGYLAERIATLAGIKIQLPDDTIIQYKEALA